MEVAIAMTVFRRPFYLRPTLEAWSRVRGIEGVPMYFYLEPSDQLAGQVKIIQEWQVRHGCSFLFYNHTRLGVLENPYQAIRCSFADWESDFVILAEEDVEPAADALEYFAAAREVMAEDKSVIAACAWSDEEGPSDELTRRQWFNPWLWGTSKERWEEVVGPTWDHDYSSADVSGPGGWDCNLGLRVVRDKQKTVLFPRAARSRHVGKWLGQHMAPGDFDDQEISDRPKQKWRVV